MEPARFVWYELMTHDIDGALAFYGRVLGWTSHDFPGGAERYAVIRTGAADIGGIMRMPEGPDVPTTPFWLGYVGTPDMAGTLARLRAAQGHVYKAPWDIPGVGKIAIVADPNRVAFALIEPASTGTTSTGTTSTGTSQAFDPGTPGHGAWHELHTPEPEAGLEFYTAMFGWHKGATHDMGPAGTYQIFAAGGMDIGGIVKAAGFGATWIYYFGTADVAQAAAAVRAAGGTVVHGPSPIPGGSHILMARDPQGAAFALVGPPG